MRTLAVTIRAVRQRLGQTMADFAELIGTEQSTVSRYESGQIAPSKTVLILLLLLADEDEKPTISEALGISQAREIETQFLGAKEKLLHYTSDPSRGRKNDSLAAEFAAEASEMLSAGAPVAKSLLEILRLWRLHGSKRQFQRALEQMLPYFRFVAIQNSEKPRPDEQ